MTDGDLHARLTNIAKRYLEAMLAVQAQREEINALASVVSAINPQLREIFDQQLQIERFRGEETREQLRQQLLMLDLSMQNHANLKN
jgi:hypothetical protein